MRARGQAHAHSPRLDCGAREQRTRELMYRVRRVALRVARRVPRHVDRDEIVSAGYLGLAEALGKLGPEEDPTFERYAMLRARGAILDYLRSCDLLTRGERAAVRRLTEAVRRLTFALGRLPSDEEFESASRTAGSTNVLRWPVNVPQHDHLLVVDELPCGDGFCPEVLMIARRDADSLRRAMNILPQRLRRVLELLYFDDACLREIGMALGVSESRVCQLRQEAIFELRLCLVIERVRRLRAVGAWE